METCVHVLNSVCRPLRKPSQGFKLSLLYSGVHVTSEYVKRMGDQEILDDSVGIAERPWSGMWASSQRVLSNCSLASHPVLTSLNFSNALNGKVLCGQIWDLCNLYIQIPLSKRKTGVAQTTNA